MRSQAHALHGGSALQGNWLAQALVSKPNDSSVLCKTPGRHGLIPVPRSKHPPRTHSGFFTTCPLAITYRSSRVAAQEGSKIGRHLDDLLMPPATHNCAGFTGPHFVCASSGRCLAGRAFPPACVLRQNRCTATAGPSLPAVYI